MTVKLTTLLKEAQEHEIAPLHPEDFLLACLEFVVNTTHGLTEVLEDAHPEAGFWDETFKKKLRKAINNGTLDISTP